MKKILLQLILIVTLPIVAQNTIPNGNFEQWTTKQFINLDYYVTPIFESQQILGSPTVIRSTDKYLGNYSVRLETKSNGIDTIFGFLTAGEFGQSNGFSFTQTPDSLVGYYKSGVLVGDTAVFLVNFSNQGNVLFDTVFTFVGSQTNWSQFSFPINLSQTPDSCFIAVASSNAINEIGIKPGSWLMLDEIGFTGAGVTQVIPNFGFENWTIDTLNSLNDWAFTDAISQTIDNQEGNFALKLETIVINGDTSYITHNGQISNGGITGGHPFTIMSDTLIGFYKYIPSGNDTAAIVMSFQKNGSSFNQKFYLFQAQSSYTSFNVPFNVGQVPDSMFLVIASSINGANVGSALYLDDLKLKSIVTNLNKESSVFKDINLYPNPTSSSIRLELNNRSQKSDIQIVDNLGRIFYNQAINSGRLNMEINMESIPAGNYYLRIYNEEEVLYKRITKL